jgi:multidrug efflux pump subunit AcrA (membrane-fusion protein)
MKQIVIFALGVLLYSCRSKQETSFPTEGPITESIYASGVLKTSDQYQAFVTVNGIISELLVQEGDSVHVGSPLLTITNETQRFGAENAELAANFNDFSANQGKLEDAKLLIETAKNKFRVDSSLYSRQKNLWEQQIGTKVDFELKELAYKSAKANYLSSIQKYRDLKRVLEFSSSQAKKNLQISANQAQDFTLKSKTNGIVYSLLKTKGEIVSPQTPIAIIGNYKDFVLELQVDENDILRVQKGLLVLITLDSYKNQVFEATVTKISEIMNERSKTFLVDAKFTKAPPKLFPNITFEANILLSKKEKALLIPRNYLKNDSIITLASGEERVVKLGLKDFQKAEIISGLKASDEIIKPK